MPWNKRKSGDKWEVYNKDTGEIKGEHDTEEKAKAQLAALYANADPQKESEKMDKNIFIPIRKINADRREVWGWGAVEEPDHSDEILDYESSKPFFLAWSGRAEKRSGGKSKGNVRAMHQPIAAGKLLALRPDDVAKGFYVGAQIVDEEEWKKVEQGVYTGFSVGGNYAKRWPDQNDYRKIRYTADPTEISIVDAPCIPSATFEMVKAEGVTVKNFNPGDGKKIIKVIKVEGGYEEERRKLGDALRAAFPENDSGGTGVSYSRYYIEDWDDSFVYVCDNGMSDQYYKIPYTQEGEHYSFDAPISVKKKIIFEEVSNELAPPVEKQLDTKNRGLEKQEVPSSPEPIADIPLESEVGLSVDVEKMPNPSVPMEITETPPQNVLAEHTVQTEDMTPLLNAWMPKISEMVKAVVKETLAEEVKKLSTLNQTTNTAPVMRSILVKRNSKMIHVMKGE